MRVWFTHHTRQALLALALFTALAVAHTWPIADAPAHWARVDNGDGALNIWAINWVGSHLFSDPLRIAEANIFYPERRALAFSEMLLVQGAIAAPAIALGAPPVAAFNVAVVTGFILTGWAFCLLVRSWTGSWLAGLVAGSLAAFNAHTLVRTAHVQTLHLEFLALALFALDRLVCRARVRDSVALGVGVALQGLTSLYLLAFTAWALAFAALARLRDGWRTGLIRVAVALAAAVGVAVVLLWPYLSVFLQVRAELGFSRGVGNVIAASWGDYLATGARVHRWWSPPADVFPASYSFPGIIALILVLVAATHRITRQDPRFRMCAVVAVGCAAVSMAGRLPFYPALHAVMPLFQAVRVQAHLGQIVLIAIAVLAGFGTAVIMRRWPARASIAGVALLLLVNVEALRAPIGFVWFDGVPGVYAALAKEGRAVVVELPFPIPQQWFLNGPYMVNSTSHWQPMLNGYSGFRPESYERSYEAARGFPAQESLMALHERGVTHVIVHRKALGEDRVARIAEIGSLQEIASEGDIAIYRLR